MTCLGCNALESCATVTLLTGEVVCPECPSYRLQCEAESMLNRMTLEERREQLQRIEKARGHKAKAELMDVLMAVAEHRRQEKNA